MYIISITQMGKWSWKSLSHLTKVAQLIDGWVDVWNRITVAQNSWSFHDFQQENYPVTREKGQCSISESLSFKVRVQLPEQKISKILPVRVTWCCSEDVFPVSLCTGLAKFWGLRRLNKLYLKLDKYRHWVGGTLKELKYRILPCIMLTFLPKLVREK